MERINDTIRSTYRKTLYPRHSLSAEAHENDYTKCYRSISDPEGPLLLPCSYNDRDVSSRVHSSEIRREEKMRRDKLKNKNRNAGVVLGIIKTVVVAITIVFSVLIYQNSNVMIPWMEGFVSDLDGLNWWAPLVFSFVYALWTTFLLPGEFLVLAAGYVFTSCLKIGPIAAQMVASASVMLGLWIGGSVIFLVSRTALQEKIWNRIRGNPLYESFIMVFDDGELWYLLLFRASPLIPFAVSNIILGLTQMSYLTWCVGLLGCVPAILLSVHIGSKFKDIEDIFKNDKSGWWKIALPLIPAVLCILVAWILVRRRLKIQQQKMRDKEKKIDKMKKRVRKRQKKAGKRVIIDRPGRNSQELELVRRREPNRIY